MKYSLGYLQSNNTEHQSYDNFNVFMFLNRNFIVKHIKV